MNGRVRPPGDGRHQGPRQAGAPARGAGQAGWAGQRERGSFWLMRLTLRLVHLLGRGVMRPVVALIVFYFYASNRRARRAIAQYQARLARWSGRDDLFPARLPVYRQFLRFGDALLDKFDVWQDKITLDDLDIVDPDALHAQMTRGPGQILVGAHLGNMEICRALAQRHSRLTLSVLVHTRHAPAFNRLLREAGVSSLRLLQVTELDAATMMDLQQRLQQGEWLAIAGDRVPVHGGRSTEVDFLGHPAPFAQGPWLLAGLLGCPVNLLVCTRQGARFRLTMTRLYDAVRWQRHTRTDVVTACAQGYARALAEQCLQAPDQWFNFYPYWSDHASDPV